MARLVLTVCAVVAVHSAPAADGKPGPKERLAEAQTRHRSLARAQFHQTLLAGDRGILSAFDLASFIAAEEKHAVATPAQVLANVTQAVDALTASVRTRLQLARMYKDESKENDGSAPVQRDDSRVVAIAALSSLFGSPGSADDITTEQAGFFRGNAVDYYDPRNSFVDEVLDRRVGIPVSLSLVYMEVSLFSSAASASPSPSHPFTWRWVSFRAPRRHPRLTLTRLHGGGSLFEHRVGIPVSLSLVYIEVCL